VKNFVATLKKNNFLKNKLLRRIFILSVLVALGLPLTYLILIHPSFEKLLTQDKKDDALRIANYLCSLLPKESIVLTRGNIPAEMVNEIEKYKTYFGLVKIKIYSKYGETIFSTDERDVGYFNRGKFFEQLFSKRQVYTNLVSKNQLTSEGQEVTYDLIETYVPLLSGNKVIGALEIYYDITERVSQLKALAIHSCVLLHSFTLTLLMIIILILIKEYRSIEKRRHAEEALRGQLQFSQQLIDTFPNPIFYKNTTGKYLGCNLAFEKFLGKSKDEIIGRTVYNVASSREWGEVYRKSDLQIFQQGGTQLYETSMMGADNRMHYVMVHKAAYHDTSGAVAGLVGVITDITELKLTEEALRASENKLHVLSSYLLTVQEKERRLISLALHDELGQSLTLLKLQLRSVQRKFQEDQEELRKEAESILLYVDQVIERVRRLSRDLSPAMLEDLGLSAALRSMFDEFTTRSGIKVAFDIEEIEEVDDLFPLDSQILIYRIFQESLTNIGRHSGSQQVSLAISRGEDEVTLVVEDYGKGFDMKEVAVRYSAEKGLGLAAIDERARMLGGALTISSSKGKGTRLTVVIPLETSGGMSIEPLSYSTGR
jgi:PAS domain S-box-containing protein